MAYGLRTFTAAEKEYIQLKKKALAIMFVIKKLQLYIYLRHFTLITDQKSLQTVMGPKRAIPFITAARF